MQARARVRYLKVSPKKMRRVAELIKGKPVEEALNILNYTPKIAAHHLAKTVKSAAANAIANVGTAKLKAEDLTNEILDEIFLELVKEYSRGIVTYKNSFQINGNILYGVTDEVEIEGKKYNAYIYLDEKRRADERSQFLKKMIEAEEIIKDIEFKNREEIETFLTENIKGWKNIFQIVESSAVLCQVKN